MQIIQPRRDSNPIDINVKTLPEYILPMFNKLLLCLSIVIGQFGNDRTIQQHNSILIRYIKPLHIPNSLLLLVIIHRRFDYNQLIDKPKSQCHLEPCIVISVFLFLRALVVTFQ